MKMRVLLLLVAIGGGAATFLPWRIYEPHSYDGWHSGGMLSFVAFAIALAAALYKPQWYVRIALFVLGMVAIVAAARAIGEVGSIHRTMATSFDAESRKQASYVRVGTGAWLVIACSIGLVFGAFLWRLPKPGQPAALPRAKLV